MRNLFAIAIILSSSTFCTAAGLPRSTPEAQGVSSAEILAFIEAADKEFDSLNSIMVVRHGHVVVEGWWAPYHADVRHSLFSLSKSFTSTAVGLAVTEGKLSVNDAVLKFFPDEAPSEPTDNLKRMRISDLLRMSTGHQNEPPRTDETPWAKSFLTHPVLFKPGTHFQYNTPATYMQSAIVQKVTGTTVLDYLKPRLFDPLGIENPTWETSPQGISAGGFGLSIRTEDIARFGQLYLQRGMWQGKQLVPEEWVAAATARQTSNGSNPESDWDQGYGYQFWRCRHGGYRGDGAFGQFCIVLPDQDAVIAITSGLKDMQAVLDRVWSHLLPAMKTSPLPANDEVRSKLELKLKGLSLRPQDGAGTPAQSVGKKYIFPFNDHKLEAIRLESRAEKGTGNNQSGQTIVMRVDGIEHRIECGQGEWNKGKTQWGLWNQRGWGPKSEQLIAASGAWTSDDTFKAKVCFYETPFTISLNITFFGDEVRFHAKPSLSFDVKSEIQLSGITGENVSSVSKSAVTEIAAVQIPLAKNESPNVATKSPAHDFAKWEKAISAFEAADQVSPPPKGGSLFIGSSTIALWKTLAEDFPDHKVINRGFGGSEIVDSTYFADRIIFPYEPRQIFLRAGGNDIHGGRLPDEVAADFGEFVRKVHGRLPKTEIYYIAVSPAPARWGETDKYRELNDMIRKQALKLPRVSFVDAYDVTLDVTGQARKELFVDDMLHLNADGYKRLTDKVRPYLPTRK